MERKRREARRRGERIHQAEVEGGGVFERREEIMGKGGSA